MGIDSYHERVGFLGKTPIEATVLETLQRTGEVKTGLYLSPAAAVGHYIEALSTGKEPVMATITAIEEDPSLPQGQRLVTLEVRK